MKSKLELEEGKIVYEFSDEEEYEGKKFVSLKKVTTFKEGAKKYQNLTCKPAHWEKVSEWLLAVLRSEPGSKDVPF